MRSVDEELAYLNPEESWRPDAKRGWTRFHERRDQSGFRTQRWLWAAAAAAIVCACLLAYPRLTNSVAAERVLKDGFMAPDFVLKDSAGADVRLSDYRGKAVVLNFWATWCRPCRIEMPMLAELESQYKARGLEVVGVSVDDDGWKSVRPFVEKNPVPYPVVIGDLALQKRYGVVAMPMTVLIDREGKVAGMHLGIAGNEVWEREIEALIRK